MMNAVMQEIERLGYRARAVPVAHLPELMAEFDALHGVGTISDDLYADLNRRFRSENGPAEGLVTVLVVARPAPVGIARFLTGGKALTAQVPPTYMDYESVPPVIESELNAILSPYGWRAERAGRMPQKLLAVRSGLGQYGRNNICYVQGLGSFVFLSSYYTDMPCGHDPWGEARRMAMCDKCSECAQNCPTGAIRQGSRVIDAARCLTLHNEMDSSVPFPDWIDRAAHNSLVGCMRCQAVCPVNRVCLDLMNEPVQFTEAETDLILSGAPLAELPAAMLNKMRALSMASYYETLARNLRALYSASAGG